MNMKRFLSYIEEIQKQRKLTKTQVYLATFGILLFLAIALILPNYLVKRQQIYKSRAQTTAALTPSGPVVINGQNGTVITGLKITSTTGDCVQIINSTNITIKESEIGPCNGRGISISGGSNNDVYDNYIHVENTPSGCCDTRDGILIENGSAFDTIQGNVIAYGESNIEVQTGSNHDISVIGNFLLNPRGPYPRGQNFQSWGTDGSHPNSNITVSNNYTSSSQDTTKYLYAENQEDSINFGHTTGITVQNNYVAGGHSDSGCGIIADADANSANFSNNILSDTGQCGIGIANGTNQVVNGNKILNLNPVVGAGNTALYVWSTYTAYPCGPVTVSDNIADEIKEDGVTHSGFWNGGGCGTVTLTNNTFNQAAYDILYPMASTNPPPLIPVQPKNCVANSPYTTNTSLAQCGSGSPSSSPSPSPSPSPTPTPSANLVGYWEFDEGTGTTAAASSGSSNAGTLINGAFWTAGKTGSAVSFDGVDDAVTIPASTKYDSNTFTTSFWINPLTLKSGNGNSNMIMGRETYITKGFRFGLNTNGAPSFWTTQSGGSISLTSSLVIPTNAFSHVVVTYDGSVGKMYINGSTVVFCHCWRPCDTLRPSPTPCVKGQIAHAASHRDSCSHRDRPRGHLSRSL